VATRTVTLDFALAQSCNRPWTEVAAWLGPKLTGIVARFDIGGTVSPALVPIGGLQTSPMKLAQAYAALKNGGMLPDVRYLAAAIGPTGNILGVPQAKAQPSVMSRATALAVLDDLRGPVKRGTARSANSVHALVYGKTGTSSRNEDALFVGLTEQFVGSLWLGHDRPAPMPGVHGGGAPAKAFANLTDFYYMRLAQARAAEDEDKSGADWLRLRSIEPIVSFFTMSAALGFVTCLLLLVAFYRRQPAASGAPVIPINDDPDPSLGEAPGVPTGPTVP
jgi:penicillin-binding protein 1A